MSSELGLRERKKARTRDALIEAAERLFFERGFEETTVDDIAAAADVSRRTFFRYFANKEAVAFPQRAQRLQLFREQMAGAPTGLRGIDVVQRACEVVAVALEAQAEDVRRQQKLIDSSATLRAQQRELDEEWRDAMAETLMRDAKTDAERSFARIQSAAIMASVRAVIREWIDGNAPDGLVVLGHKNFATLRAGLGLDEPALASAG